MSNGRTIKLSDNVYKDLELLRLNLLSKLGVEYLSMSNVISYLLGKGGDNGSDNSF